MGQQCFNVEKNEFTFFVNYFILTLSLKFLGQNTKLENLSFTLSYKECRVEGIPVKNNALTRVNQKISFPDIVYIFEN